MTEVQLSENSLRVCTGCGNSKPATAEYFQPRNGRLISQCRSCGARRSREYRNVPENLERIRQLAHDWQKSNRPKINANRRRKYREGRLEPMKVAAARSMKNRARRLKENPSYRLKENVGKAVLRHLRGAKARAKWQTILGYSVEDLRRHLERQFADWMTWENYGTEWHVDHVVPLCTFSFTGPDDPEFKAAWDLTNLRPLRNLDNWQKGGRREFLI